MLTKKNINKDFIFVVVLSALILSGFHTLRFGFSSELVGYEQYYYLNSINSLKEDFSPSFILEDTYLIDVVVSLTNNFFFWMRFLPFVFGLINIYLICLILKEITKNKKQIIFSSLIIFLSPVFVYVYGTYNRVFSTMTTLLLGTYLLLKDKYWISLVLFVVGFILNPPFFIAIILVLIVFYDRYKAKSPYLPVLGILITGFLFIQLKNYNLFNAGLHSFLTNYVSDLGALFGLGIFELFVSILGIILSWSEKEKFSTIYFALLALLICSLFDKSLLVFLQLVLAYFGGVAISYIWKTKWKSSTLKNYVLILIFCGLIFSAGSFINRFSQGGPVHSEAISLNWLRFNAGDGKVISHHKYGFLIQSMSGLETYTDERYYSLSKDKTKIKQSQNIFMSRNLEEITSFMKKNDLKYIWINEEMKQGLVWKRENEGMLLILHNSDDFNKVYDYAGVKIWELRTSTDVSV